MEHRNKIAGHARRRFAFRPLCEAPRERVQAYLTDVYATVCGEGLTRREARRLAFRLWGKERKVLGRFGALSEETRMALVSLADTFLSEHGA